MTTATTCLPSLTALIDRRCLVCDSSLPLAEAANLLLEAQAQYLVVVEAGHPRGVWSLADALALDLANPALACRPLAAVLNPTVTRLDKTLSAATALALLQQDESEYGVVCDNDGTPLGITTPQLLQHGNGFDHFLNERTLADCTVTPVVVLAHDEPATIATMALRDNMTRAVVALDDGHPIGYVIAADLVRAMVQGHGDGTVGSLARRAVLVLTVETTLSLALALAEDAAASALIVTTAEGTIYGLLTVMDLLAAIRHDYAAPLESVAVGHRNRLAETENRLSILARVVEQGGNMVLITDGQGIIEYVNPSFERISGHAASEVLGQTPRLLKSDRHPASFYQSLWGALQAGHTWRGEICNRRRNGSLFWVQATISPMRDVHGHITHYVAVEEDITARKAVERELQRERQMFTGGPVVTFVWRAATNWPVSYVSPNVRTLMGYEAESLLTGRVAYINLIHPEDAARVAGEVAAYTEAGGDSFEQEYRIVRADGAVRWIYDFTVIVRDEQGLPIQYQGYVFDNTDRKLAEVRLKESEERFRRMADTAPVLIWVTDTETRCVYLNRMWLEFTGRTLEEELGLGWIDDVHPDDLSASRAVFVDAFRLRSTCSHEFRLRHHSGAYRWVLAHGAPRFADDGSFLGYIGSCSDITDRRTSEEALTISEQRYRTVFERSAIGITRGDLSGRCLQVNPAFAAMLGCTTTEIEGRRWAEWSHPDDVARNYDLLNDLITGRRDHYELEKRYIRKDGTVVWVRVVSTGEYDADGQVIGIIGMVEDITRRKKAEAALRASQVKLVEMATALKRSNAELEQFSYVASHDLQEPLRIVSSYLQLLDRRYSSALDDKAREYISYAVDGAKRMQRMILDLLEYSRVERMGEPFGTVALNEALQEALDNLHIAIEESGARITSGILPTVQADRSQVVRVFQNLIGNAIKYADPSRTPDIRISARPEAAFWIIAVADNGIGIEERFFERVFQVFQRLHGSGQARGAGIGLAITKRIITRHGGRIWVTSEPGEGSTFAFTLPEVSAQQPPAADAGFFGEKGNVDDLEGRDGGEDDATTTPVSATETGTGAEAKTEVEAGFAMTVTGTGRGGHHET